MCNLLEILERDCLGVRPRAEEDRECRDDRSHMLPGVSYPGDFGATVSWERVGLPEPLQSSRGGAVPQPACDATLGLSAQRRSWGEWRDFVAS